MGLVETEAIILRTYKLAEADKIAICLTREAGIVRGVARGARRLKSRFGASLEPFTLVALSYFEKEGRELVSLGRAEILRSYFSLAREPEAVATLEYMSELAIEFAPPHQPDEKLFRMVRACIEASSEDATNLWAITRYYETWMLKLAGFLPDLRVCGDCGRKFTGEESVFLAAEGSLRCAACANNTGLKLSPQVQTRLRSMQIMAPSKWATHANQTLSAPWNDELARLTQKLIERALERKPKGITPFRTQTSLTHSNY